MASIAWKCLDVIREFREQAVQELRQETVVH